MPRTFQRMFLLLSWLMLYIPTEAQTIIPSETIQDWQKVNEKWETANFEDRIQLFKKFPLVNIQGKAYFSMIGRVNDDFNTNNLPNGVLLSTRIGRIVTLKVPVVNYTISKGIKGVEVLELSRKVQPDIVRAVVDLRADSVNLGINLSQAYTGKNVIIGITDWGFDYTHPMFYDTSLTNSRILASWDQFRSSGTPPTGFNYGSEIVGSAALQSALSDTACVYYDYATHGSHVAGIAGGGGAGIGLKGPAFDAEFLFSQFYLDAGSSIDAVNWMKTVADNKQKRLVINMSWGLYHLGPFDGTSLLSEALDNFSNQGVLIITSGGNNGNVNFHIEHSFSSDTIDSQIEFYTHSKSKENGGQSISAWGSKGSPFSMGIEAFDGTTKLISSPFYNTSTANLYIDSFLITGTDTITYNLAVDSAYPTNDVPHIRFRVKNTNKQLKVIMRATANSGKVHFWNVTELTNGAGNWGMPFVSFGINGVAGNSEYGVGEPAATKNVVSIAAHGSGLKLPNGNIKNGPLASFSSRGPTVDERIKPDVSAPGISVNSSISSFTTESHLIESSTTFKGKKYEFSKFSGTSMASPAATGVAALILEADPNLTPEEVKEILMNTAREDDVTGVIALEGNVFWGHGKVTATAAIREALGIVGRDEMIEDDLLIYPNPTGNLLTIDLKENKGSMSFRIYNSLGGVVYSQFATNSKVNIDVSELQPGFYFIELTTINGIILKKFIKN